MLAQVALATKNDFMAADVLRWFLDHYPNNAKEQAALGEIYCRFGRFKDALPRFAQALEQRPENKLLQERIDFATRATCADFDPRTLIESSSRRPKLVVFISDSNRWREAKLARGLRALGWNVVLLFRYALRYEPEDYYDACYRYEDPEDALAAARTWNADIYHMFTQLNYETAEVVLSDKPGTVVIDPYDSFEGGFEDWFYETQPHRVEQREKEGAILAMADGICSRDLVVQTGRHRFSPQAPNAFYSDYCWNDPNLVLSDKLHCHDGELHVVFASSIMLKTKQGEFTYESYHWFAKILNENAIHFHIYPMIAPAEQAQLRREFSQLERDMPYFHFHEPIFGDAWLTELSQYDVGVCFSFVDAPGMPKKSLTDTAMKFGIGAKVTDYLDAGLVTLSSPGGLNGWIAKRYGFGECVDWQGVHDPAFWRSFSARVLNGEFDLATARKEWSIAAQSQRLVDFYESVICQTEEATRANA